MSEAKHKGIGLEGTDLQAFDQSGNNYLLVIAIDDYVHCPKLNNCVKDAKDLIALLTSKYRFEAKDVYTLFNEEATRPNIHTKLKTLKEKINPGDNLLPYFSGHGQTEDQLGYWIPVDAKPILLKNIWRLFCL